MGWQEGGAGDGDQRLVAPHTGFPVIFPAQMSPSSFVLQGILLIRYETFFFRLWIYAIFNLLNLILMGLMEGEVILCGQGEAVVLCSTPVF